MSKLSDKVREVAVSMYIRPARKSGKNEFSIPVRGLSETLDGEGFPRNHIPQICSAIQAQKFLREQNLEIVRVDGPEKKQGTTVVVHYRVIRENGGSISRSIMPPSDSSIIETPKDKADRLIAKIRGVLRDEIASYGGAEGFIRWVRSEEDEDAR
ncbi:hypothetical protein [Silvibacterium dinghuense]|uniref:Uncharacterized protein n=1 Tax=Silvibacterium dinghuense TaxID=1560006 RepID=A0A4Q1SDX4_9BACT|nr:hypothetical protein [Silvibacterium dinghuense]RXS95444.1 hypothetical protein ESZ00_12765 [Silvibacterium dinghuense]GGH13228.1 hypothetical protein GCM10011586_32980 [Silvibacterium dinghuense]